MTTPLATERHAPKIKAKRPRSSRPKQSRIPNAPLRTTLLTSGANAEKLLAIRDRVVKIEIERIYKTHEKPDEE